VTLFYQMCRWNWWYKGQLSWGIRSCIWSILYISHENFVRNFGAEVVGREDTLKLMIGNKALHENNNDNLVTVVNFIM